MLQEISGIFFKIAFASEIDQLLTKGCSTRPAGRYNRIGQAALYLSESKHSAQVALKKYLTTNDPHRVLLEYEVEKCQVLDLRHPDASSLLGASRTDWQKMIAAELVPTSWEVADSIRQDGHVGLIDPSRKQPDLWHLTLFRWNETGAPTVTLKSII